MEIILYSNDCPQCKVLEVKLKQKGVIYKTINDIDIMVEKGFKSMPMLEVNSNIMTYAQALKWLNDKE